MGWAGLGWAQVTYQLGDDVQSHEIGQSTNLLAGWRRLHDGARGEDPDTRWMQYRVWGQPAAWCDQIICTWISEYLQELYPQGCIQIVDCLGSQWSPEVVLKCWAANQAQIPIAPNSTSYLQVADTHVHATLKAYILAQKERLQAEFDQFAAAAGQEREANWGLRELSSVMGEAWHQMLLLQADRDVVLHAAIKNQLLAFRPDQDGTLQRIDQIIAPWTVQHPLLPPSKGITYRTAQARLEDAASWPEQGPPEPEWQKIDQIGSYLHQLQEVPGREEAELDLRFEDLQLTPQQLAMAASPESRLKKLTPVRYGVAAHMESRARIKAAIRHRTQKPGKSAQKLSARCKRKFAQEALQKLEAAGSLPALSNTIMPAARGQQRWPPSASPTVTPGRGFGRQLAQAKRSQRSRSHTR